MAIAGHGEGIFRSVGDCHAVLAPAAEGILSQSGGCDGAGGAVVEGAATCDGAAFFRVSRNGDGARFGVDDGDVGDIGLTLRFGDHDMQIAWLVDGGDVHVHNASGRHEGGAQQLVILGDTHV